MWNMYRFIILVFCNLSTFLGMAAFIIVQFISSNASTHFLIIWYIMLSCLVVSIINLFWPNTQKVRSDRQVANFLVENGILLDEHRASKSRRITMVLILIFCCGGAFYMQYYNT